MVNYRYDLKEIERNHEAFANECEVAASRGVRGLLRPPPKVKPKPAQKLLALPSKAPGDRTPPKG
jgi:malonyl-CoA decarboxylase